MPRGDRTGPSGAGPITGKGMGYCADNDHSANKNSFWNRAWAPGRRFHGGQAYGRGGGFRFRGGYGNYNLGNISDVSEKTLIENEIRILKDQLSALEDRLSGMDKK